MKAEILIIALLIMRSTIGRIIPFQGDKATETCVACKFIWENIEEALTSSSSFDSYMKPQDRNPILASESFQYFCRISPDIFFEPCNIMFEKLFFMCEDFVAKLSPLQICKKNDLC